MSEHTTTNYTGMIAYIGDGWVSRYNGLTGKLPGCYAVSLMPDLQSLFYESSLRGRDVEEEEDMSLMTPKALMAKQNQSSVSRMMVKAEV